MKIRVARKILKRAFTELPTVVYDYDTCSQAISRIWRSSRMGQGPRNGMRVRRPGRNAELDTVAKVATGRA